MYRIQIPGCITFLIVILLLAVIVKELWFVFVAVAGIIVIAYYGNLLYNTYKNKQMQKEYTPEEGEVFKVCPKCGAKIKISTPICPYCNTPVN